MRLRGRSDDDGPVVDVADGSAGYCETVLARLAGVDATVVVVVVVVDAPFSKSYSKFRN